MIIKKSVAKMVAALPDTKTRIRAMSHGEQELLVRDICADWETYTCARKEAAMGIFVMILDQIIEECPEIAAHEWNTWADRQPDGSIDTLPQGCTVRASKIRPRLTERTKDGDL